MNFRKALFIAISVPILSLGALPADAQQMYPIEFLKESNLADELIYRKQYDAARTILLRLIATHHGRLHEYVQLANCYLDAEGHEDYDAAEKCANKAISLNPDSAIAYSLLAKATLEKGNYTGAIAAATEALDCKKPNQHAVLTRAHAYNALHEYTRALQDFEQYDRVISKSNKSLITVSEQGHILEQIGRIDDAIKKYRADTPYHLEDATRNIVRCLQKQKKYPEAIAEISILIKHNAQDSDAYNLRAGLKAQIKNWKGAVADYDRAINLSPTSTYYKNRAEAFEALGLKDLARKDLLSAEN